MLNNVTGEVEHFSSQATRGKKPSNSAYGVIGFTSTTDFKKMVWSTVISNVSVTFYDVISANKI